MRLTLPTEAMARACARHPWKTAFAWIGALLIAGFLASSFLGDALTTEFKFTSNPESKRADKLLEDGLRGPLRANEIIIVRSNSTTVDNPAFVF